MENIMFYFQKYLKEIILGLLVCASITLSCFSIFKEDNKEVIETTNILASVNESEVEEKEETLYVDVKGAVNNPGVYEVEEGSIINDVITLAGGFAKDAVASIINLSKKVSDEMVIYVYKKSEVSKTSTNSYVTNNEVCNTESYNIMDCVEKTESIIISGNNADTGINATEKAEITNKLVNINTASKSELTTLNGIGDAKATAIIAYRNTNGNFSKIEDILNVSGIGDAIFANIKDYITV